MPFSAQAPWFVRSEARGMVPHGMLGGSGMGRTDTLPIAVPSGAWIAPADLVSGIGQGNSQAGAAILDRVFHSGPLGMAPMHTHGGFGGPKNIAMGRMKMPRASSTGSVFSPTKSLGFQQGGPVLDPVLPPYDDTPTNQQLARRFRSSPSASRFEMLQEDMEQRLRTRPDVPVQQQPKNIARGGAHMAPPGHTPIVAASGEYVVGPEHVLRIGKWNGDPRDLQAALKRGHDVLDKWAIDQREKHRKTLAKLPGPVKRAG
jgi:hypothetical protein